MDKLRSLRDFMTSQGLEALLIPHADEFQGEYLAPNAERLKWLTGFTGSAGFAVISQEKAAFFTDDRYTLQAKEELPSCYELHSFFHITPAQWVADNLSSSDKIGYDPWLFTEAQLQRYTCCLVPLPINPIDTLWTDRPPFSHDLIWLHPLLYAGESDQHKRDRLSAALTAEHVLITACDSIAWLLNIRGNDVPHTPLVHSVCLLHKDGSYDLFIDPHKVKGDVLTYLQKSGGRIIDKKDLLPHLKKLKGDCQVDPQATPVILIQTLQQAGVTIHRTCDPCILPKALKNDVEIQGAIQAHLQDGIALCRFFSWLEAQPLKGETTELTAAHKLNEFRRQGKKFQDYSFETISAFGPHGAIVHYRVTPDSDVPLTRDGLYLVDSGGQYLNGTTDVTRTIALGAPTAEQKDRYTRVLKGHIAIAQAIFPKDTAGIQLDGFARQFLWDIGADYSHGTGHGVGSYLCVHEGPQRLSKWVANEPLHPGMILSNEPGYYKKGAYGIRCESLVHVIEIPDLQGFYGFESLTLVPFDLNLIEETLLIETERTWLKKYHDHIFKTLSPHVDAGTRAWIERSTKHPLFSS